VHVPRPGGTSGQRAAQAAGPGCQGLRAAGSDGQPGVRSPSLRRPTIWPHTPKTAWRRPGVTMAPTAQGAPPPSTEFRAIWVRSRPLKGRDRTQVAGRAAENAGPESAQLNRWVIARPHPVLRNWPGWPAPPPDRPLNRRRAGRPSLQAHRAGRRECHLGLALGRGEAGRGAPPAAGPSTTEG
jgi:hypothetical protein